MLRKCIVISFLMCLVATSMVYAQGADSNQSEGTPVTQEGNVSFDFRDADIRNVFRILSFKSGVNIVAGPEVTGVVTMKLDDVPWKQALEVILETYGYAHVTKGSIISVTTIEILKQRRENVALLTEQEPLQTRIFVLSFAKASEAIESIGKMRSARGSINFDERTNSIIVTDISSRLELIEEVVETLDTTTPQVLIEAKIIETNLDDSENLGIDWTTKASASGASRSVSFPFKRGNTDNRFAGDITIADPDDVVYGTLGFTEFQAVLELLKSRTDTNILSNPKIVTLDNKSARIEVGTKHPIPSFGANSETGALQTTGIVYENIGINFTVTPHVNNDEFITLELSPEVSEVTGTRSFQGIDVPLISTEQINTSVIVRDGDTLVIAGLITDKLIDVKKKMPFIGDIPIVGLLFQKTEKTITKTDLIIFITPHIITPKMASK